MYNKMQRVIAIIACISIILVQLFNITVLANEIHHHCCGHDCPVCACIHNVEQTVRSVGTTSLVINACSFAVLIFSFLLLSEQQTIINNFSLVSQKIRLNN